MKKAILVTFEIKTRVIVDADFENSTLANLDWEVAKVAADKIKNYPYSYIDAENMTAVDIDMEDPYNPSYDKVDLYIPSSKEMIDFFKRTSAYESTDNHTIWLSNPIDLDKKTSISSVWIGDNNQFKVHYSNPELENIGLSLVDWNDIATEVKIKIMKAIGYED